jgi:hypothetical protein
MGNNMMKRHDTFSSVYKGKRQNSGKIVRWKRREARCKMQEERCKRQEERGKR